MAVKPPKCKTCGAEEFGHLCSGLGKAKQRVRELEQRKPKPQQPKPGNVPAGSRRVKKGRH